MFRTIFAVAAQEMRKSDAVVNWNARRFGYGILHWSVEESVCVIIEKQEN